jgi:hypothetical protein
MKVEPQANIDAKEFVKLTFGKTRILLPAEELLSIEPGNSVSQPQDVNDIHAHITINHTEIHVYAFDDDLRLQPVMDNQRQVCVCLGNGHGQIGILCDDANAITLNEIKLHDLPACMHTNDSVIFAIAENNNNLYCISKTADLVQLINSPCQD